MSWGNQGIECFTAPPTTSFRNQNRCDSVFKRISMGRRYIVRQSKIIITRRNQKNEKTITNIVGQRQFSNFASTGECSGVILLNRIGIEDANIDGNVKEKKIETITKIIKGWWIIPTRSTFISQLTFGRIKNKISTLTKVLKALICLVQNFP